MAVFEDNTYTIGRSPLVKLGRIGKGLKATVFGKVEGRNPAYSVKCRTAAAMVWDAEKRGVLKPGGTLVEPTSGNTGIGLAFACAARGYKLIVTMPESYSVERVKLLRSFGAQVELTTAELGMSGAIQRAEQILGENPDYFMPQQFKNPANPRIHYETTGPEIYEDLEGKIDVFVAGVGTGGTITGVGRYLKEGRGLDVETVAVEPAKSAVLSGENPGPHSIDGIGAGFIPDILDITLVDRIEKVSDEESIEYARRLAREEGLLCGISCGAATAVAMRLARDEAYAGKNIVCVLPDTGERYLSTMLFEPSFLKDL